MCHHKNKSQLSQSLDFFILDLTLVKGGCFVFVVVALTFRAVSPPFRSLNEAERTLPGLHLRNKTTKQGQKNVRRSQQMAQQKK